MLADEPLDGAFADAVALSELPLRGTGCESGYEPFQVGIGESLADPWLTGRVRGGADAGHRHERVSLRLPKPVDRSDQLVCEVQAFGISSDKLH